MELVYDADTDLKIAMKSTSANYVHFDKHVETRDPIALGHLRLKWYDLAKAEDGVPGDIETLARDYLVSLSKTGQLGTFGDLGFVILHRCGDSFYFLLVSTWNNKNELWESVYAKQTNEHSDFAIFPLSEPHHATFCVWELAIVSHEQQAWRRFLLSKRDGNAKAVYLDDLYRGSA
ncbi:MAG TPA: hypothetical protein PLL77_08515 [Pyrinomonadaceae bacterium]|nr:hypothetical protein [Pyrinomonadaceae bacterium]